MTDTVSVEAEPYEFTFQPSRTALLVIDMQRDFVERGGFGEMLGNDVTPLKRAVEPTRRVLGWTWPWTSRCVPLSTRTSPTVCPGADPNTHT